MTDEIAVLGVAATSQKGAVTVARVIVRVDAEGDLDIERLEAWQGSPRDEERSLADLTDALANTLDPKRKGAPIALAVKRTETPPSRPTVQYDQKIRAEGAAMIAAASQGRRYFAYRSIQLRPGSDLHSEATTRSEYPSDKQEREAVAAACTALAELREGELDG